MRVGRHGVCWLQERLQGMDQWRPLVGEWAGMDLQMVAVGRLLWDSEGTCGGCGRWGEGFGTGAATLAERWLGAAWGAGKRMGGPPGLWEDVARRLQCSSRHCQCTSSTTLGLEIPLRTPEVAPHPHPHPRPPAARIAPICCTIPLETIPHQEPTTTFHEISHNLYLNHAGKWGNKGYDDMSGAMGYCCDLRCVASLLTTTAFIASLHIV